MELLNDILPIILYFLGIAALIVLIILGIKLIRLINRTNDLLDDVEAKVHSLNGVFNVIDTVTDGLAVISDRVIEGVSNVINRMLHRKKREEKVDE